MQKTLAKHCSDCSIFTGIHATFSRGDYFSVEGIPLNKIIHTWSSGEPDAYGNRESCIIQLPDNATLADVKCSSTFPYFCYKKMSKSLVLNNCGTSDNGYTLNAKTRSCYKFHRVPRTWSRAYMTCAAEGGYLVILNSETEVAAVKDIFAKNPASTMIGNFEKDVALVGFNDWNEHGEWLTINGDTLQEAGYYKFSPGQPDNATGGEYCGSIFRTGLLNDIWCEKKFPFICEMVPNSIPCI